MLDIVIVGGGLCGLALADRLQAEGRAYALFEARDRLGGRILTLPMPETGLPVDVGPTWIWPEMQPAMAEMVAALGLETFPQHATGSALVLSDPDKKPREIPGAIHDGAHRVKGGMGRLIDALAARLPADRLHTGHVLTMVSDRGDHVVLTFRRNGIEMNVQARAAILALPPRLVEERIGFQPDLDETVRRAMRATTTWMAYQAKALMGYPRPFWREQGWAGDAFVTHEQAVFGQIYDACDPSGTPAALGAFLALDPESRRSFRQGLPMLMDSQIAQVFAGAPEHGDQIFQDWAAEPFTCSTRDLTPPDGHPDYGDPALRRPVWGGKLHFGASETASYGGGYLEGALEAARRIGRDLAGALCDSVPPPYPPAGAGRDGRDVNADSLSRLAAWVVIQADPAFDLYRRRINHRLATQQRDQLTQRAVLDTMEQVFSDALAQIQSLPFDLAGQPVENGRSALTPRVQSAFDGFLQTLLDRVVAFNRTSCALSNFPDEHDPSHAYMQAILRDLAAAWAEFSRSANGILLSKSP
jgi:monoamine oxidase